MKYEEEAYKAYEEFHLDHIQSNSSVNFSYRGNVLYAGSDGELKIALYKALSFEEEFSEDIFLRIIIRNGSKRIDTTAHLSKLLGNPAQTPLHLREEAPWFLYGRGPFKFFTALQLPNEGADATVLLNHRYEREFLGYDCSRCCPCDPIYNYTYDGEITNQNLGDAGSITAASYDWGKEFDFPEKKYLRIYRSFFGFDFDKFWLPSSYVTGATLNFRGAGPKIDPDGPQGFTFSLSPVLSSWTEYGVTWENQPTVASPVGTFKNPRTVNDFIGAFENYELSIEELVRSWIAEPGKNFGLRISLDEEEKNLELDEKGYSQQKIVSIAGSDTGVNPWDTNIEVYFSNQNYQPEQFTLDAAPIAKGDTVIFLVYNEAGRTMNVRTGSIEQLEVDGEAIVGYRIPFKDRFKNTLNSPLAYLERTLVDPFIYIGEKKEEIKISLEMPEQDELWPSIPIGGANAAFDFSQVESVLNNIQVEVTRNEEPVPGQPVAVMAQWVEESGGHSHDGKNDKKSPPSDRLGIITNIETADSASGIINTITNAEGRLSLRYRTPEFGGEIKLIAKTVNTSGDTLQVESQFTVAVPDLVLLPDGDNYEKVGGTPSHYGPRVDGAYSEYREPDNNHYATEAFKDSLIAIADAWADSVAGDSTLDNRQAPLNINDISLPNGGKFDIEGRWLTRLRNAAHDFHRVGRDVDIRTSRNLDSLMEGRNGVLLQPLLNSDGSPILDDDGIGIFRNRKFEEISEDKGASPTPRIHGRGANEHYHIYFY